MSVAILPTKPNVEASWQRYVALLHELQANPALEFDPDHSAKLSDAEQEWSHLFRRWSAVGAGAASTSVLRAQ